MSSCLTSRIALLHINSSAMDIVSVPRSSCNWWEKPATEPDRNRFGLNRSCRSKGLRDWSGCSCSGSSRYKRPIATGRNRSVWQPVHTDKIKTHQQNTLFWTVLDRATQIHRAHSLVHSGQVCPDTHSLWVPVQLCPDTHSYELLSSSGQYNPNSSIILPFITRLS